MIHQFILLLDKWKIVSFRHQARQRGNEEMRQYGTRHRDSDGPHRVTEDLNMSSVREGGTGDGGREGGKGGKGVLREY